VSKKLLTTAGTGTALMLACMCVLCLGLAVIGPPPTFRATETATGVASASQGEAHAEMPTTATTATACSMPTASHVTYVVQSGDSLSSIAARFATTAEAIMKLNGLTSTTIYSGTTLLIATSDRAFSPPPSTPAPEPRPTRTPDPISIVLYRGSGGCSYDGHPTEYMYLDAGTITFQWREPSMWPFGLGVEKEGVDLAPDDPSVTDLIIQETSVQPSGGRRLEVPSPGRYRFIVYCRPGERWQLTIRQE